MLSGSEGSTEPSNKEYDVTTYPKVRVEPSDDA
jgi:hypothetical protein